MTTAADSTLRDALRSLSRPDLLVDFRRIAAGDELALLDAEARSLSVRSLEGRRASGAARLVARKLLERLGADAVALPKAPNGAPLWPAGFSGSLAHDDHVAIAAVGRRTAGSIGIDIEPAQFLPAEIFDLVVTAQERRTISEDPFGGRLLFTAKEAAYKAVHPLDGIFLDFHDIEVDLAARQAVTRNGRTVALRFCISTHLVALALA